MSDTFFHDKNVLITGACGTVGRELVRQMAEEYQANEVFGIDNNETELFFLEQAWSEKPNARFSLADVRDPKKLERLMDGVDIVFHTAAYKHVVLCERSPFEAVQTNIIGVRNVIQAALECGVERLIFTSSDKAVNPTNVMGTSKLMGERLITAANSTQRRQGTILASTRFGNVLGSRGSVIPIFLEQIKKGGPVTLTHADMTRFIMSIPRAVQLVIDSAVIAKGGEVFITKMPVIKIQDLAQVMIRELSIGYGFDPDAIVIKTIGTKPGEKMYEELMSQEETRRTIELAQYFVVLPAFASLYTDIEYSYPSIVSESVDMVYNSANVAPLSHGELATFLTQNNLLDSALCSKHPDERYWPGASLSDATN